MIPDDFIFEIELSHNNILKFNKSEFLKFIKIEDLGLSANGILYKKVHCDDDPAQGIIPEILTKWSDERDVMRDSVKKYGKELNEDGSINIHYNKEKKQYYDTHQKIQKTLLNSIYGVLGLSSFRYYDLDNATAVTTTGVDLIKFSESILNSHLTKTYGKYKEMPGVSDNYVHYVDTDSCFVKVEDIIKKKYGISDSNVKEFSNKILIEAKQIQSNINNKISIFSKKILFADVNYMLMKQELIASAGLWTTKKRYALLLVNKDGLAVDELEVKGLDSVRTSFPKVFRDFMTQMLKDILMAKSKEYIDSAILDLKQHIDDVDILDIARPTSIKEITKFCDNTHQPFNFTLKGTPAHVKAAINYNDFLRYHNLDSKFAFIGDGEKIKWLYLEPDNPFRLDTLAFKDNDEDPKEIIEYIEKHIDRSKVFDSEMEKKLHDFYVALGWGNIPTKVYQEYSKFF
jgi:hypothetical protein